jgi:VWFA-related protein
MFHFLALVLTVVFLALPLGGPVVRARSQAAAAAAPGAGLVPVDVQVLDRNGKPVTGLTPADFTILEDGAPQQVRYLSPVAMSAGTAEPDARLVLRKGLTAVPQDHRIFVLALGQGRLEDPSGTISGLVKFVKTRLLPQDQVAIFAYDRALSFTTDHQKVAEALERFKKGHPGVSHDLSGELGPTGMATLYGSRTLPKKLQAKIDELILGPGAPPATPVTAESIQPDEIARLSLDAFMASCATSLDDENSLFALLQYLRYFEGQKHVIFVTETGLQSADDTSARAIAALANDARASLHPIPASGLLSTDPDYGLHATLQQAVSTQSLRTMSDLTGGLASLTEKGQAALDRLDETTRSGYLLGFQSSRAVWDGGYRQLVVRVNRPDTTVLYRHGYYRIPANGYFDRREFITSDRLSAGGNFRREVGDIKVKVSVSQRKGTTLVAEGKIDLSKVKTASVNGARQALLTVAIYCLDGASNATGTHMTTVPVKVPEADYERILKDGFPFSIEFPIIRGTQNVRFVVYDFGSDLIGRADAHVL